GDHAVGLQVLEVLAKGFHRVKAVLAQRKCPCGGGSPGVNQSHLQDVVTLVAAADKRSAILYVDSNARSAIKNWGIIRITIAYVVVGDQRIYLDPGDVFAARSQRA